MDRPKGETTLTLSQLEALLDRLLEDKLARVLKDIGEDTLETRARLGALIAMLDARQRPSRRNGT